MRALSKLIPKALLVWAVLMPWPSGALAQQSAAPKRVLVLHWYDRDYPVNGSFDQAFQAALKPFAPGGVDYYSEYLETNKFPGENQALLLRDYLRQKYAGITIDVVVTNSSPPLDFLLMHRGELFPHTPIVFATERLPAANLMSGAGAAGFIYDNTYRATLDLALRLHPGTKQLLIISGTLSHDKSFEPIARNELQGYKDRVAITYLTDLTPEELTLKLRNPPKDSIAIYVWQQSLTPQGKLLETQDVLTTIAREAEIPLYGLSYSNVGLGIIGGYVYTREGNAAKLAEITLRVASGARAADIPLQSAPNVPMFDWRQLQRWGISEDRLPPGSIIRFRELTMWQQYKWRIAVAIVVFGLLALLIVALLVERQLARRGAAALARAQRVIQESEERFRSMADTAPVMIWVSGPDKLCTFFNRGWLTFTGRTLEQELPGGWTESLHPDDLDRCFATYSSSFDARRPFQMECRRRRADGEYRSLLSTGVPRFQQDGVFAGYIGSSLDITDLKRAQESALAGQKLESLGALASGMAHDFKNLLGGILASAELALAELAANAPHKEELLRIKAAAVGGAEIVRELMIFGGNHSPAFEPVDCSLLVREIIQVLKVSISKYATLKTELADDLPTVHGNPAQIRQLIMNLVLNASQALGEQTGEIRVTAKPLTADQSTPLAVAANLPPGDYLQLEVADTGSGMTEETKARIFDPFFTTKTMGRGLGLAVVQGVVRAHRGAVNVVSAPGSGAAFQVLLPCTAKDNMAKDDAAKHERESHTKDACQAADECLAGSGTVLIIEDEETLRMGVSKMFRIGGFSVIEAADGNAAVDLFLAHAPQIDVVLLDMSLPGKSGREVLGELQRIRPDLKVIVTSAYGQDQVQNSLDGLRPCSFVQKPYQLGDLAKLLRAPTPISRAHSMAD